MKRFFPVQIYLAALFLRLVPVILFRNLGIGSEDMFQYDMLARSLSAGNGYRWYGRDDLGRLEPYLLIDLTTASGYDPERGVYTSFRAPLYPAILSMIYAVFGTGADRIFAARLIQAALLGAPLAPLTYFISRAIHPGAEGQHRFAAILVAGYPMLVLYPLGLGTENPFALLLAASTLALLAAFRTPSAGNMLMTGALLGLTALTRSVILFFAFLAILGLFIRRKKFSSLALAAFLAVTIPWITRNSLLHNRLTGIETSMGYNLYLGYHPQGDGGFIFGPSLDLLSILDDSARDRLGTARAVEFIRDRPQRFIPLALNRLGFFFGLEQRILVYLYSNNQLGYISPPALLAIMILLLLPFMVMSLLAAFSLPLLPWDEGSIVLALLFGGYIIPHVLILSEDRFHLALIPFLAILASRGWMFLSRRTARLAANWTVLPLSAACAALLLLNWGVDIYRNAERLKAILGPDGNTTYFPY
jgi:hypothetical protein